MKPKIFIGSTKENLEIAYAIQSVLSDVAYVIPWNQGIFELSNSTLDNLLNALNEFNYAIFVFNPNDISVIRDIQKNTVRDNVIFELGLFLGKLGKERVFYLIPSDIKDFHLPTDLLGITAGLYDSTNLNLNAAVSPFCTQVRRKIKETFRPIFLTNGYYGMNILSNENDNNLSNADKYSFSVKIPKDSSLKIQMTKLEGSHSPWFFDASSRRNWIIDRFDLDNSLQVFKLVDNDKADLQLFFVEQGKAVISIYFNEEFIYQKEIIWK